MTTNAKKSEKKEFVPPTPRLPEGYVIPEGKLDWLDFLTKAVTSLRGEKRKGIHYPFSGVGNAMIKYYEGNLMEAHIEEHGDLEGYEKVINPPEIIAYFAQEGTGDLFTSPSKKGIMIYLDSDKPKTNDGSDALKEMGLDI